MMASKAKKTTSKKTATKTNGSGGKTQAVIQLMRRHRAKGVTRPQVLALTGWKAINMNAIGVKLKIDKSSTPYRYSIKEG
jgi:hypothetical protein